VNDIRCDERYCDKPATHYTQESYRVEHLDAWGHYEVPGLKVGWCADHAPADAKPIDLPIEEVRRRLVAAGIDVTPALERVKEALRRAKERDTPPR
jgi:hypothetical protein